MHLNEKSPKPLYFQIYEHIKQDIEDGTYPQGAKLPSIRSMAENLQCSRNTVEGAYSHLSQEGFIAGKPGSGYIVQGLEFIESSIPSHTEVFLGDPAQKLRYDFTYGDLEVGTFPALQWRALTDEVLMSIESSKANVYPDAFGELDLRQEIAWRLTTQRDIICMPDQVVIQGGTQSSVQNLLNLFDSTTDSVAMEEPGYDGVRSVFKRSGFQVYPCRISQYVGDNSSSATFIRDLATYKPKLIYVTPSSQFPTCTVMPQQTRQELIEWANTNDAYILEDDYCRDFRYKERPIAPLISLDTKGRVIYMGTFSKSLSPALRMNYLVLPHALMKRWKEVFSGAYSVVPWLSQAVLARFMKDGSWERHVRRVQVKNRRKYQTLITALENYGAGRITTLENGTGLHLLVVVNDGRSEEELIEAAAHHNVAVYGTKKYWHCQESADPGCVLIGFSAIAEQDIEPGIAALMDAWF